MRLSVECLKEPDFSAFQLELFNVLYQIMGLICGEKRLIC